jgi:hypothetical protein
MRLPVIRDRTSLAAFAGYAAISFLYFGVPLLPHFGRSYVGYGVDPEIFIWAFEWWPHAILNGENPFVTHSIWAPEGQNLTWTTTPPGIALPFAPLTLLAGPLVSFNVASILMPALAAWTAFVLCRYLTRSTWASLVGGYLFGFSSYMLGHMQGHMHMTSVFLLPLVALVLLQYVNGELGRRGLVVRLGVMVTLQLLFSTAASFTLALALATSLAVAFLTVPGHRARIRLLVAPVAASYALAAVLTSPFLYYALTDFQPDTINDPTELVADVVNVVVPTQLLLAGGGAVFEISRDFTGNDSENTAYVGLPVLVILAWFAWARRRTPAARFLVVALVCTLVAALGAALHVRGRHVVALPWTLVDELPLFNNLPPVRLTVYLALITAVAAALWTAARTGPLRVVLPALAVLALVPAVHRSPWDVRPPWPPFFTAETYRDCLRENEVTLVFPFGRHGDSMLWQAAAGFHFRMAGGYLNRVVPDGARAFPVVGRLGAEERPRWLKVATGVREFAHAKGVTTVVVDATRPDPWRNVFAPFGAPLPVAGVLLYSLEKDRSPPPGCR